MTALYQLYLDGLPCLLSLQASLENKSIFSGTLFQYLEENKKWRNRFFFVPDSYNINYYDNKSVREGENETNLGTICTTWKTIGLSTVYVKNMARYKPTVIFVIVRFDMKLVCNQ